MEKGKSIEQMALFDLGAEKPAESPPAPAPVAQKTARKPTAKRLAPPPPPKKTPAPRKPGRAKGAKKGSGLVPEGDVRLTANIREDLHLRLKLAAARRRTTIGELIEDLVERHI